MYNYEVISIFRFGSFIRGFGVSDSDGSSSFLLYGTTPGSVLISSRPSGVDASIFPSLFSDCLVFWAAFRPSQAVVEFLYTVETLSSELMPFGRLKGTSAFFLITLLQVL